MDFLPLTVNCEQCGKSHLRNVKVIEPEAFSKTGQGSVLSQFWCPKCGQVNAIRYEFYRDCDIIKVRVKSRELPMTQAIRDSEDDDEETED